MNIQTAIQKAEEITGINAQQVLNECNIGFDFLGTITEDNIEQHTSVIKQIAERFDLSPHILVWLATNEKDVKPDKLKLYQLLKPAIDSVIEEMIKLKGNERDNNTN